VFCCPTASVSAAGPECWNTCSTAAQTHLDKQGAKGQSKAPSGNGCPYWYQSAAMSVAGQLLLLLLLFLLFQAQRLNVECLKKKEKKKRSIELKADKSESETEVACAKCPLCCCRCSLSVSVSPPPRCGCIVEFGFNFLVPLTLAWLGFLYEQITEIDSLCPVVPKQKEIHSLFRLSMLSSQPYSMALANEIFNFMTSCIKLTV